MNRDDIIRMAREAGMAPAEIVTDKPVIYPVPEAIERFAKLVAAAEREKIAQIIKDSPPLVAATIREKGKP